MIHALIRSLSRRICLELFFYFILSLFQGKLINVISLRPEIFIRH